MFKRTVLLALTTLLPLSLAACGGLEPSDAERGASQQAPLFQAKYTPTDRNECFAKCLAQGQSWKLCKAVCYSTAAATQTPSTFFNYAR